MKFERIPKKLFGNDPDETPENNYFESFFNSTYHHASFSGAKKKPDFEML